MNALPLWLVGIVARLKKIDAVHRATSMKVYYDLPKYGTIVRTTKSAWAFLQIRKISMYVLVLVSTCTLYQLKNFDGFLKFNPRT